MIFSLHNYETKHTLSPVSDYDDCSKNLKEFCVKNTNAAQSEGDRSPKPLYVMYM